MEIPHHLNFHHPHVFDCSELLRVRDSFCTHGLSEEEATEASKLMLSAGMKCCTFLLQLSGVPVGVQSIIDGDSYKTWQIRVTSNGVVHGLGIVANTRLLPESSLFVMNGTVVKKSTTTTHEQDRYMWKSRGKWCVSEWDTQFAGISRFLNGSPTQAQANCGIVWVRGIFPLLVVLKKTIPEGQELLVWYGYNPAGSFPVPRL
jgi:hypothetical protein